MRVLLTGGAGFIGMHVSRLLVDQGHDVLIVDNPNDYYDPQLKYDRLDQLEMWHKVLLGPCQCLGQMSLVIQERLKNCSTRSLENLM